MTAVDVTQGHMIPWVNFTPDWKGWRSIGLSPDTLLDTSTVREGEVPIISVTPVAHGLVRPSAAAFLVPVVGGLHSARLLLCRLHSPVRVSFVLARLLPVLPVVSVCGADARGSTVAQ